mmetsp:Transcript_26735/g.60891  ORF Transcript_26735/g.60891 Transcript_26735/m.60891 type:complete len:645 (+) Transcript_26735:88-2022(+)
MLRFIKASAALSLGWMVGTVDAVSQDDTCRLAKWNHLRSRYSEGSTEVQNWQQHYADPSGDLVPKQSYWVETSNFLPDEMSASSYVWYQPGHESRFGAKETVDGRVRFRFGPVGLANFTGVDNSLMQSFEHASTVGTISLEDAGYFSCYVEVFNERVARKGSAYYTANGSASFILNRLTVISGSIYRPTTVSEGDPPNHTSWRRTTRGVDDVFYSSWQGTRVRKALNCSTMSSSIDGASLPLPDYAFEDNFYMWVPMELRRDGDFEFAVGWLSSMATFERYTILYRQGQQQAVVHDMLRAPMSESCVVQNFRLYQKLPGILSGLWQRHTVNDTTGDLVPLQSFNATINIEHRENFSTQFNLYQPGFASAQAKSGKMVEGMWYVDYGVFDYITTAYPWGVNMAFFSGDEYIGAPGLLGGIPYISLEMAIYAPGVSPALRRRCGGLYRTDGKGGFTLSRITTIWEAEGGYKRNYSAQGITWRGMAKHTHSHSHEGSADTHAHEHTHPVVLPFHSWQGVRIRKYLNCTSVSGPVLGSSVPPPDYVFAGDLYMWAPMRVREDGPLEFAMGWNYNASAFERLVAVYEQGEWHSLVHDVFRAPETRTDHLTMQATSTTAGTDAALVSSSLTLTAPGLLSIAVLASTTQLW